MLYFVAFLMLGTALVLLQISRKKSASRKEREQSRAESRQSQFASVTLNCGADACQSAQSMRGKVFLASEAPMLPLAACDTAHCLCKYAKTSDRRGNDDGRRAVDIGIQPIIFDGVEHRSEDRRAS